MRRLILLGTLAALALSARGEGRQTLKDLDQKLAAATAPRAANPEVEDGISASADLLGQIQQDGVVARQINGLELSERLTRVAIEKYVAAYKLGPESRQALEQLADRSALLEPPADNLPAMPAPDEDTQRRMVEEARAYVLSILPHLPDLFAVRTTHRFDNLPVKLNGADVPTQPGLRPKRSYIREITFREGREIINSTQPQAAAERVESGLESRGEFGPEPAVILLDLRHGTIAFHHWEQTGAGVAAVYHYSVPAASSRYQVNYSCVANAPFHQTPGYHGSLSIDPATGTVLRITLEADWKSGDPISHIASVIEYGPVVLGERRYICPLRSLAFMVEEANACGRSGHEQKLRQPVIMLNQTSFTDYHRLGSSSRIVEATANPDPDDYPDDEGSSPATPDTPPAGLHPNQP